MTKIAVIIGSTREGRSTDKLAKWVAAEAAKVAEVETLDLRDYPMPFYEEAGSARYMPDRKAPAPIQKWLDALTGFDAFIIVTPEYNRSMTGVLKNAIGRRRPRDR
ncbi:MAG: NAD(P)H-dependent oxidoreductase [Candidatus Saccharibacteria bacterium]